MIKINLLPKEARKRVGVWDQIFIIILGLLITIGGITGTWNYLNGVIEQRQQEIAETQQRLDELKKVIAEIEEFEKQRAALEQKLEVIATLEKEQQLPVHFLDELYLTLEEDLWLNSFNQSGNNLNIRGTALSNPVVADYLRRLDVSEYFGNVELTVTQSKMIGGQEVRDFQIKAILTPPQDEDAPEEAPEQ
jgi:type IV pilus assembly protein PilN